MKSWRKVRDVMAIDGTTHRQGAAIGYDRQLSLKLLYRQSRYLRSISPSLPSLWRDHARQSRPLVLTRLSGDPAIAAHSVGGGRRFSRRPSVAITFHSAHPLGGGAGGSPGSRTGDRSVSEPRSAT